MSPCEGSSYFPLSTELRNPMKGSINTQNVDNECLMWCLVRYLNLLNHYPTKCKNVDREFAKHINFTGAKFSVHKKDYAKIEKQNSIFISVFGYENIKPYCIYTYKQTFEKHVDLLLSWNSKYSHFVFIKAFNIFMTNKTRIMVKNIFFDIAYNASLNMPNN